MKVHSESQDVLPASSDSLVTQIPPSVPSQAVWRLSFAHRMTEGWFPKEFRPAAMQNIVFTYESFGSAPVMAIQDALSMLHAGSVSKSDHILAEARKKYTLAINSLRLGLSGKRLEMPVSQAMILATITVMSEVGSFAFISCVARHTSTDMTYAALNHSHPGIPRDILRRTRDYMAKACRWHVRTCPHMSERQPESWNRRLSHLPAESRSGRPVY